MRLLIDPPARGSWNMAVDEALLASAASSGEGTLRVYSWLPATLSLGYFQSAAEREGHHASHECPLVRRASGGGAILHDREVTYSLTMPCGDRFDVAAMDVYRRVHQSLIETFATWGIHAQRAGDVPSTGPAEEPFLCFARRSPEDIVVGPAKIVGSAQRRHHGALLQHGSILLARSPFAPEIPGLLEAADQPTAISFEEFIEAWLPHFRCALSVERSPGELTNEEHQAAESWAQSRFATDDWNRKR